MLTKVFSWPFESANSAIVAGLGFWLGTLGIFLTALGFILTFFQLAKTRSLAQATKEEAERIRSSLVTYDAVHEAARAAYTISAAQRHLRSALWSEVASSYEDYRRSITSIKSNVTFLTLDQQQSIDQASTYIQRLCERIERDLQSGSTNIDVAKTLTRMKSHDQLAFNIQQAIHRSLM